MNLKKNNLFLLFLLVSAYVSAQKEEFTYKFYGFVRTELYGNSRASVSPFDDAFFLYPMDKRLDADGQDLNAHPAFTTNAFVSRAGVSVTGPTIGGAKTSACLEVDFAGYSGQLGTLRFRQAYVGFDWEKNRLIVGQTWHPLFGQVFPDMLNLSTGAPFQPFNRSPQIQYKHLDPSGFSLTAAALWQYQYVSNGPVGKSNVYLKEGVLPELFVGVDYASPSGWLVGAGAHMLSLKPRTESTVGGKTYKVSERMTAPTFEAHASYKKGKVLFGAKTLLASAMDCNAMLGGYGISGVDARTGEQEYTPFHHSSTWVNFSYGTTWKPSIFIGYTKNLGTSKELVAGTPTYGMGLDIDQLLTFNVSMSYLFHKHWMVGAEYSPSTAWYGTPDKRGRVKDTHSVTNHRAYILTTFFF